MNIRFIILTLVFGAISLPAFCQTSPGIKFEVGTLAQIKAKAAKEKKLIFIDAYTTWCGPCKAMAKNAFPLPEVGSFYNANFVNAKIDMEKGEGIGFAKTNDITMYPTLLFLNAEGAVVHRSVGGRDGKELIELGKIAINPELNLAGLARRFKVDPSSFPVAYAYLAALRDAESKDQKKVFDTYLATQEDNALTNLPNWRILFDFVRNSKNPLFKHLLLKKTEYAAKYSNDSVDAKIKSVYYGELRNAADNEDSEQFNLAKENIRKLNLEGGEREIAASEIVFAGDNLKLKASKVEDFMNRYANDDPDELNEYAWMMYQISEDPAQLQLAESWVSKGVLKAPSNSAIIDTYAHLLFKNGKTEEAKVQAEKAIQEGEKSGSDVSGTKKLLEEITGVSYAPVKKEPSVKKKGKK